MDIIDIHSRMYAQTGAIKSKTKKPHAFVCSYVHTTKRPLQIRRVEVELQCDCRYSASPCHLCLFTAFVPICCVPHASVRCRIPARVPSMRHESHSNIGSPSSNQFESNRLRNKTCISRYGQFYSTRDTKTEHKINEK